MGCSKCGIKKVKQYPVIGATQSSDTALVLFTRDVTVYTEQNTYVKYRQGLRVYLDFLQISIIAKVEPWSIQFLDDDDKQRYLDQYPGSNVL